MSNYWDISYFQTLKTSGLQTLLEYMYNLTMGHVVPRYSHYHCEEQHCTHLKVIILQNRRSSRNYDSGLCPFGRRISDLVSELPSYFPGFIISSMTSQNSILPWQWKIINKPSHGSKVNSVELVRHITVTFKF